MQTMTVVTRTLLARAIAVVLYLYMSTIMVLGAIQDTTIPATSPLVMYDEGWTNSTTNPAYMQVVNGSVYFSAK
ncbi:hypothetical protein FRB91_010655, partial [Serendipita sp. 411]